MSNKRGRVECLSDDSLIEILSRLPTKSLHKFQSVSKDWKSLISYVLSQRKLRVLQPISGFYVYCDYDTPCASLLGSFIPTTSHNAPLHDISWRILQLPPPRCKLIHTCNGLMLLSPGRHTAGPYYIWNPVTMEFLQLPPVRQYKGGTYCFLAYDPRKSPHYNLVRFSVSHINPSIFVHVYSSRKGKWGKFKIPHVHPLLWKENPVFLEGALYLLSRWPLPGKDDDDYLLRFDIRKKTGFELIKLPEKRPNRWVSSCIGQSREHLCYAVNVGYEMRIYTMLHWEGRSKWVLTGKMSTEFLDHHPLTCCNFDGGCPRPIAFHPESELIYLSISNKILSYQPSCDKLEEVFRFTGTPDLLDWTLVFPVYPCLESMDPPGGKFIKDSALKGLL